jgi:mRNA interferase HigB
MRVITKQALVRFWDKHRDAENPLIQWYRLIETNDFESHSALKRMFPSADLVDGLYVFNIGGNKYRLVCAIHFNRGKIFIRHVLTHAEYDRGKWKQ